MLLVAVVDGLAADERPPTDVDILVVGGDKISTLGQNSGPGGCAGSPRDVPHRDDVMVQHHEKAVALGGEHREADGRRPAAFQLSVSL
jgi:hypothetical protein